MAISTQTRITRARIQLCMRKPYLSTALMRFPLVQADGIIETICTDGYHIFWSESFIDSLTDAELRGVLAHELMHVITQSADRRQERDKHLWNLATDYAINQVLVSCGFRLPGGALLSPLYRDLSAERIYELLEHKGSDNPPPLHSGGSQGQNKQRKDSRGRNKQREDSDECVLKDVGEDVLDPNSPEATRLRTLTGIEMPDEQEVDEAVEATRLETLKALRSAGITGGSLESLLQDLPHRLANASRGVDVRPHPRRLEHVAAFEKAHLPRPLPSQPGQARTDQARDVRRYLGFDVRREP